MSRIISLHINEDSELLSSLAETLDPFILEEALREITNRVPRITHSVVPDVDYVCIFDGSVSERWAVIEVVMEGWDDPDIAQRAFHRLEAALDQLVEDVLEDYERSEHRRRMAWPWS